MAFIQSYPCNFAICYILVFKQNVTDIEIARVTLYEIHCVDKLDGDVFSLTYLMIDKYQRKYKEMVDKQNEQTTILNIFVEGRKVV